MFNWLKTTKRIANRFSGGKLTALIFKMFTSSPATHFARPAARRQRSRTVWLATLIFLTTVSTTANLAQAQATARNRYFPFDQTVPPGVAGQTAAALRRGNTCYLQPIRVELPGPGGLVSIYEGCDGACTDVVAPALAAIQVGPVYRLKLSSMPEFPGVELYPTVELIDRLHPPCGREADFPIPIAFTEQEIRAVIQGRLVTKVVYLEQPDRAIPLRGSNASRTRLARPRENALALADEAGRPMAIVRLGGRVPDPHSPEPDFYGHGGPVEVLAAPPEPIDPEEAQP
ncbi:MAG: hypothetical protein ACT4QC_13380 [Planctomycetaceae bacterium]